VIATVDEYRAPSWSWASRDIALDYFPYESHWELNSDMKSEAKVQYDVKLAYNDPFGQISSATLYVSTRQLFRTVVDDTIPNYETSRLGCAFIMDDLCTSRDSAVQQWLYVLPLLSFKSADRTLGLLLEPSGRMQGEYRRIGGFHSKGGSFQGAIKNTNCHAQDDDYASRDHPRHNMTVGEDRLITII